MNQDIRRKIPVFCPPPFSGGQISRCITFPSVPEARQSLRTLPPPALQGPGTPCRTLRLRSGRCIPGHPAAAVVALFQNPAKAKLLFRQRIQLPQISAPEHLQPPKAENRFLGSLPQQPGPVGGRSLCVIHQKAVIPRSLPGRQDQGPQIVPRLSRLGVYPLPNFSFHSRIKFLHRHPSPIFYSRRPDFLQIFFRKYFPISAICAIIIKIRSLRRR